MNSSNSAVNLDTLLPNQSNKNKNKYITLKFAHELETFDIESDIRKIPFKLHFQCTHTHVPSK